MARQRVTEPRITEARTRRLSSGPARPLIGLVLAALLLVGYLVWSHAGTDHPRLGPDWIAVCHAEAAKAGGGTLDPDAQTAAYQACLAQNGALVMP
jgi:hypothetical protein